jgi:hypothetical protein
MRTTYLPPEDHLPPHILDFCERLASTFWENIELLHRDSGYDELTASLYDWAIVHGVLALDVFESVCVLLNIKKGSIGVPGR